MSQTELNSNNSPDQSQGLINDFNLDGENSVITSTGTEINQSSDKRLFDQDLDTSNISNESKGKVLDEHSCDGDGRIVNTEHNEPVVQDNSVLTTNSDLSDTNYADDKLSGTEQEKSKDTLIAENVKEKSEDIEEKHTFNTAKRNTEGRNSSENIREDELIIEKKTDSDTLNKKDTDQDNLNDKNKGALETQRQDETLIDETENKDETITADDSEDIDYKDDFEDEDVKLKQEESAEINEHKTTADINAESTDITNGLGSQEVKVNGDKDHTDDDEEKRNSFDKKADPDTEEIINADKKDSDRTSLNNKVENEEQVILDGDKAIPKVILTASAEQDPSDSESESNSKEKIANSASESLTEKDNNQNTENGNKETQEDVSVGLNTNDNKEEVRDSKNPGFIGSVESSELNETLNEQNNGKYKAHEDNDDFWDTDEPDNIKGRETKQDTLLLEENGNKSFGKVPSNMNTDSDGEKTSSGVDDTEVQKTADKKTEDQGEYLTATEDSETTETGNAENERNGRNTDKTDSSRRLESPLSQPEPQKLPEKPPSPEPVKQESPLEQLLKRNVEIDGSIESISDLETNVTLLLQSIKHAMKHYKERLTLQTLRDFTDDMGKFRGDFLSITDAYQRCGQLATTMNNHLKELRHATEDCKTIIYRKFQNEDLATWIDITAEKEEEKQKLQEEVIAAERAAMAKAAEARAAMATATVGVAEANQFVSETETQTAEAEAVAKKAKAHAQQALAAVEEARIAAEEKRRAEEAAKKRAEERARKKEAEEKMKKAEEEKKIYQEAAKKGTSVEDERALLLAEKERKEAERRNPKNWPKYTFTVSGGDFDPGVGCIIRAIDGTMRTGDLQCRRIGQETGILALSNSEELISNIIEIKPVDPEMKFHFEEPMSVALPICVKRTPFGREAVIKIHQSKGRWTELPSADVTFEDNREQKFVETRIKKFGIFVVVLRFKKDNLMLLKRGAKVTSSVDSRVSFTCKPGTFKVDTNFNLELQSVDQNAISDLRVRAPRECEDLYTCSPFIKLSLPTRKSLVKPLSLTLPLPPNLSRLKRPQTAVAKQSRDPDVRPATARPSMTQERKEESTEDVHFLYFDEKTGWTKNSKTEIIQITNKDMVSFDITEPYQRLVVLRTKIGLRDSLIEKMASLLDRSLTQRSVKTFLRQRNADLYDVVISCVNSNKAGRELKYLADEGFEEGAPPSKDLILKEGQPLYIKFRGNVSCITENPKLNLIFNTHITSSTDLKVVEMDTFAQKGLPCYRGFAQVFTRSLVPKPDQEGPKKPNELPEMMEAEILLTELLIEIPKPETEPPKPLHVAPIQLNDGPLNDSVLHHLSNELGKEWKDVAANLNLKATRIQAILRQNVNKETQKTRYDMLVSWAKRIPKSVDKVQILVQALQASGRTDLAEEIRYRGEDFKQKRIMSARVSHLRQAFVKVAKANAVFKHWKDFAKGLGVPDQEIKKIEEQGGSGQEKCYTSLETWKELSGERATIPALATHLKGARQDRLSRDVQALIAD